LLVLALVLAACGAATPAAPVETEAPAATEAVAPAEPVLEIVGPSQMLSLTLEDLKALPATEGYAGIKSSTGKITPPMVFTGVSLKDLSAMIGGMDETTGFSVVAEDGYSITFSYDQIHNGTFIAYDPATGQELKSSIELTAILAYAVDGKLLDPKQDGTLRLAITSDAMNQVTDGHWSVKWVNRLEVKSLGEEWALNAHGAVAEQIDRASIESCGAPQCHGASWIDDKAQEWVGVPLWLLVGAVDDAITHEGPAFNDALVESNYGIDVIASDGYSVTFDAARVARNDNILLAFKVNDNPLVDKYFPLRLVGSDLAKNEMAGAVVELAVGLESLPPTPEAAAVTVEGALVLTGLVKQPLGLMESNLRALQVLQITAEHPKKGPTDYEGISLNSLLGLGGVKEGATTLVMSASDGYTSEVSLEEVRACSDCLVAFTDTTDVFSMVMPGLSSGAWVKGVVRLEVK
jgi:DMSO/TMAO reductase YedYZ molybdopterin-dependent catalytic subunit